MEVVNDSNCSWINDLNKRSNIQIISSDLDCEWLIVGAGYTGSTIKEIKEYTSY